MKSFKLSLVLCGSLVAISLFSGCVDKESDSEVFRKYVISPIPESVHELKIHHSPGFWKRLYAMYFKINKADLQVILDSKQFQEMDWVSYWHETGQLRWGLSPKFSTGNEPLGHHNAVSIRGKPRWFRPDNMSHAKVYAVEKGTYEDDSQHWQVLIYDETSDEAYFVEYYHSGL